MGYSKINAIELLKYFENRPAEYASYAHELAKISLELASPRLAWIAARLLADSQADTELMAIAFLELSQLAEPLEFGVIDRERLLPEPRTSLPATPR